MSRSYSWQRLFKVKRGHAFFYDASSKRYAIADDSGRSPEFTDDGVLWLDESRPAQVVLHDGRFVVELPLIVERDRSQSKTIEPIGGLWSVRRLGILKIELCPEAHEFACSVRDLVPAREVES